MRWSRGFVSPSPDYPLQPLPLLLKAIPLTIGLPHASGTPATYLVYHVGGALDGSEAVSERVSEGVYDTSIGYSGLKPLVDGG